MPAKYTFTDEQIEILIGVVRRARKRFKNQTDLAKALRITQQSLSAMLAGKWSPGLPTAQHIAELEQLNLEDLLPDFKATPSIHPSRHGSPDGRPNLEKCIEYYEDELRWSPWTIAAARAGFFGANDMPKSEWVQRLDLLEKIMSRAKRSA